MDTTKQADFLRKIDQLSSGERAALRHACGSTLEQAEANALTAFYRKLPQGVWLGDENSWFMGACLRCMWRPEEKMNISIEQALGALTQRTDGTALDRRLIALLDTPMDKDGYFSRKLWRLTKLLKQQGYVIDCASLIVDVCLWNRSERYIQKKWARAYCQTPLSESSQDDAKKGAKE